MQCDASSNRNPATYQKGTTLLFSCCSAAENPEESNQCHAEKMTSKRLADMIFLRDLTEHFNFRPIDLSLQQSQHAHKKNDPEEDYELGLLEGLLGQMIVVHSYGIGVDICNERRDDHRAKKQMEERVGLVNSDVVLAISR
jgi:hypothetical protein